MRKRGKERKKEGKKEIRLKYPLTIINRDFIFNNVFEKKKDSSFLSFAKKKD